MYTHENFEREKEKCKNKETKKNEPIELCSCCRGRRRRRRCCYFFIVFFFVFALFA